MPSVPRLFPTALIALALSACASTSEVKNGPQRSAAPSAIVQVTNNNWADMNVYMLRAGMRVRLGTVTTMGSRRFQVPKSMMSASGEVRLIADPIGSRGQFTTAPVQFWPGQTVDFKIENHIAVSSIAVW